MSQVKLWQPEGQWGLWSKKLLSFLSRYMMKLPVQNWECGAIGIHDNFGLEFNFSCFWNKWSLERAVCWYCDLNFTLKIKIIVTFQESFAWLYCLLLCISDFLSFSLRLLLEASKEKVELNFQYNTMNLSLKKLHVHKELLGSFPVTL